MATMTDLRIYLLNMRYPTSRQDLILKAQSNYAPEDVMDLLSKLPDRTYQSEDDLDTAVGSLA